MQSKGWYRQSWAGEARGLWAVYLMKAVPRVLKDIHNTVQMVFEEFGFKSFLAMPAQPLSLLQWQAEQPSLPANTASIALVVDAGKGSSL